MTFICYSTNPVYMTSAHCYCKALLNLGYLPIAKEDVYRYGNLDSKALINHKDN